MTPHLERDIEHAIRAELGLSPGLVLYRNAVGRVQDFRAQPPRWISYGLAVGSSDLVGIARRDGCGCGRFIALEVKQARGRERASQARFRTLVQSLGGFAAIVRSTEEAQAAVARARAGEAE
jgi:hypothetical protein